MSEAAIYNDWKIEQGTTFAESVEYKDADGNVIPLTDYSVEMRLARSLGSASDFVLTEGDGLTIDRPAGKIDILITAEKSALLNATKFNYEINIFTGVEPVIRILKGYIQIYGAV